MYSYVHSQNEEKLCIRPGILMLTMESKDPGLSKLHVGWFGAVSPCSMRPILKHSDHFGRTV
jgi:hypothetical protein